MTKACSKCKQILSVIFFGKNKGKKDGLQTYCKSCQNQSSRRYRENNPEKRKETMWNYYLKRGAAYYEATKASRRNRILAVGRIGAALREGKMLRRPCIICGEFKSEAHHDSYLPEHHLSVKFYCTKHHKAWHRLFIAQDEAEHE